MLVKNIEADMLINNCKRDFISNKTINIITLLKLHGVTRNFRSS